MFLSLRDHAELARLRLRKLKHFYPELSCFTVALCGEEFRLVAHTFEQVEWFDSVRSEFLKDAWIKGGIKVISLYCRTVLVDLISVFSPVELKDSSLSDEAMTTAEAATIQTDIQTGLGNSDVSQPVTLVPLATLAERANISIDQLLPMVGNQIFAAGDQSYITSDAAKTLAQSIAEQDVARYQEERISYLLGAIEPASMSQTAAATETGNGNGAVATEKASRKARGPQARRFKSEAFSVARKGDGAIKPTETLNNLLTALNVTDETSRVSILQDIAAQNEHGKKYVRDLRAGLTAAGITEDEELNTLSQRIIRTAGVQYRRLLSDQGEPAE